MTADQYDVEQHLRLNDEFGAHNYAPLPVVLSKGEGVWAYDVRGSRYLDMLSAYSALNFGHSNPRFVKCAQEQLGRLTLTSRAFYNDQIGPFCRELAGLCRKEKVLPMNTGAEAVETAIKLSRRWGYRQRKIKPDSAEIIVFSGNFHGRTTTIVSFSDAAGARDDFGPFTPGFVIVPYGDIQAVRKAVNDNTVAILVEPIQGEGGVLLPPAGFMQGLRDICSEKNLLLLADEIQTGLCRTGTLFACDADGVTPDVYILGKSLGAGIVPISAVAADAKVMDVFTPGSHGSTFGGNPLACAVAREVVAYIREEKPEERSRELGEYFMKALRGLDIAYIREVRGRGMLIGVDIDKSAGTAKDFCKKLMQAGLLCKDTREQTIRFAPPLTIEKNEIDWALERIERVLKVVS